MWMDSGFNSRLVEVLNLHFPHEENYYVWRSGRTFIQGIDNGCVDSTMFTAAKINQLSETWDHIILHSLWLKDREILQLSDSAAAKITWVVWGHDLYKPLPTIERNIRSFAYFMYKWLQRRSIFYAGVRKQVARKISKFKSIAIGFGYDELYIRKLYGTEVPVIYGPYFSKNASMEQLNALREIRSKNRHLETNIMIGHCGAPFVQHEKYLKKLASYRSENIHIYLIMSYLANDQRIEKIRHLAHSIYREDQITIVTQAMPQDEYFRYLTKMDIAVFPFCHQSALGNLKRLAFMGTKLFFDPRGVLAKGFLAEGVRSFDCRMIGKLSFAEFSKAAALPDEHAKLFQAFNLDRCISAWSALLSE